MRSRILVLEKRIFINDYLLEIIYFRNPRHDRLCFRSQRREIMKMHLKISRKRPQLYNHWPEFEISHAPQLKDHGQWTMSEWRLMIASSFLSLLPLSLCCQEVWDMFLLNTLGLNVWLNDKVRRSRMKIQQQIRAKDDKWQQELRVIHP